MLKVSWYYIPITILIFTIVFYFLAKLFISSQINVYIKKFENNFQKSIKDICSLELSLNPLDTITKPKNIQIFDKENAYGFLTLNLAVSLWSGCQKTLTDIKNFILIGTFKGLDNTANEYRDICALYYSNNLNMIIVSFSGTMYLSQFKDDLDFTQINPTSLTDNKNIFVNKYHYIMYDSLREKLIQTINKTVNKDTLLVITGHSLGGSLASLCFFDLIVNNIGEEKTLYSFGAPRTGNNEFANIIDIQRTAMRVANTEDIIVTLPLPIIGTDIYTHYNNLIPFTLNLKSYGQNHVNSYIQFFQS